MQTNENSQRREYRGAVLDKVMAVLSAIHGGQIMADSQAFQGISSCLSSIAKDVPRSPDLNLLMPGHAATVLARRCACCP